MTRHTEQEKTGLFLKTDNSHIQWHLIWQTVFNIYTYYNAD